MKLHDLYERALSQRGAYRHGEDQVRFRSRYYQAEITFYHFDDETAVELRATERGSGETAFYLQLPGNDEASFAESLDKFTGFLYRKTKKTRHDHKSQPLSTEDMPAFRKPCRILLTCTCGFSSTLFAQRMRDVLGEKYPFVTVEAVDFAQLEAYIPQYDVILLSPQAAWQYDDLSRRLGERVQKIPMEAYATGDAKRVLRMVGEMTQTVLENFPCHAVRNGV